MAHHGRLPIAVSLVLFFVLKYIIGKWDHWPSETPNVLSISWSNLCASEIGWRSCLCCWSAASCQEPLPNGRRRRLAWLPFPPNVQKDNVNVNYYQMCQILTNHQGAVWWQWWGLSLSPPQNRQPHSCELWVDAGIHRAWPCGWYYRNSTQFMTSTSGRKNKIIGTERGVLRSNPRNKTSPVLFHAHGALIYYCLSSLFMQVFLSSCCRHAENSFALDPRSHFCTASLKVERRRVRNSSGHLPSPRWTPSRNV